MTCCRGLRNSGEEIAGIFGEMGFKVYVLEGSLSEKRCKDKGITYHVTEQTVRKVEGSQGLLLFLSWKYLVGPEKRKEIIRSVARLLMNFDEWYTKLGVI